MPSFPEDYDNFKIKIKNESAAPNDASSDNVSREAERYRNRDTTSGSDLVPNTPPQAGPLGPPDTPPSFFNRSESFPPSTSVKILKKEEASSSNSSFDLGGRDPNDFWHRIPSPTPAQVLPKSFTFNGALGRKFRFTQAEKFDQKVIDEI